MVRVLKTPRFWAGILVALAMLAFALRGVRPGDLARELAMADYRWMVPAAGAVVAGQVLRAVRWRILFGRSTAPDHGQALAILSVGYLVSNVMPLRLGDAIRAWLVETRTRADGATALATVVAERAVDLLTIMVLLALWVPEPGADFARRYLGAGDMLTPGRLRAGLLGLVVVAYFALSAVAGVAETAGRAVRSVAIRLRLRPETGDRLGGAARRFAAAFGALALPWTAAGTAVLSMATWLVGAAGYWLLMRAFALNLRFDTAVLAVCAAAVLAALLPPAPGYIGALHAAVREALVVYGGVSAAAAASYAIVLHGLTLAVLVALGLGGLAYLGLSRRALLEEVGRG